MLTDPIADMLTRIRNGFNAGHPSVVVPFSKFKLRLAEILKQEKYVSEVRQIERIGKPCLEIALKYTQSGKPAIERITRVSTPGQRIYRSKDELPKVLNNYGIAIISTPAGLLTNREARKRGVGGEVVCEVC